MMLTLLGGRDTGRLGGCQCDKCLTGTEMQNSCVLPASWKGGKYRKHFLKFYFTSININ